MINKATLRANVGQRDTKEDDESDIDYDYRYWTVNGQTYHDIGENTDTTLEYEHFEKNYLFTTGTIGVFDPERMEAGLREKREGAMVGVRPGGASGS